MVTTDVEDSHPARASAIAMTIDSANFRRRRGAVEIPVDRSQDLSCIVTSQRSFCAATLGAYRAPLFCRVLRTSLTVFDEHRRASTWKFFQNVHQHQRGRPVRIAMCSGGDDGRVHWQGERKGRAAIHVLFGPQLTTVSLDNRPADRESDAGA